MMTQTFEDAGKFGKEFLDSQVKSLSSLSKTAQTIASEATDYTRRSVESSSSSLEKLFGAKSLDAAIEIQADYAKQAYEGFVSQATRMSNLYADMAKDAYKPFENAVAKAK